nr:hypothetical protein CFP56_15860 [Quercus suber]POE81331.1 hypothetical protein CFP56_15861 [Quercus suber]
MCVDIGPITTSTEPNRPKGPDLLGLGEVSHRAWRYGGKGKPADGETVFDCISLLEERDNQAGEAYRVGSSTTEGLIIAITDSPRREEGQSCREDDEGKDTPGRRQVFPRRRKYG